MAGSAFPKIAGAEGIRVSCRTAAGIAPGVLGGRVDFGVSIHAVTGGQARAGRLRQLAVSRLDRAPLIPDVPTFAEVVPSPFALSSWFAVIAAAGTPEPIGPQPYAAIAGVQSPRELREATAHDGSRVLSLDSSQAFAALGRNEHERDCMLIARAGAKVE